MKWLMGWLMICGSGLLHAESENITVPDNPKWKEECGSCHVAYPPQLLTSGDWQRLMGKLDQHFGTNATLEPGDNREILDFLRDNSGTAWGGKSSDSGLRVSDTQWFIRKHRKISIKIWMDAAVKTAANCPACHVNAEREDWSRQSIHIPIPGGKVQEGN